MHVRSHYHLMKDAFLFPQSSLFKIKLIASFLFVFASLCERGFNLNARAFCLSEGEAAAVLTKADLFAFNVFLEELLGFF